MKNKIVSMFKVAVVAAILTSCNNAEEVKKQVDAQNASIQAKADEKIAGLQAEVDTECATKIDAAAQEKYDTWFAAEGKKKGAKPAPKPKPKPEAKKEEPKPSLNNRPGTNESENKGTLTNRPGTNEAGKKDTTKTLKSRPGATSTPK